MALRISFARGVLGIEVLRKNRILGGCYTAGYDHTAASAGTVSSWHTADDRLVVDSPPAEDSPSELKDFFLVPDMVHEKNKHLAGVGKVLVVRMDPKVLPYCRELRKRSHQQK